MANSRPRRRSPEQWQAVVEQWQQSGQSARRFCQEQDVGYASFCQWRKRFDSMPAASPEPEASFIDLASLRPAATGQGWHIVLSLGNGIELTLSQR